MDLLQPVSANPDDIARFIAAIANSGGGNFRIDGRTEDAVHTALSKILPPPVLVRNLTVASISKDLRKRDDKTKPPEMRSIIKCGIFPPAGIDVCIRDDDIIVTVTPGFSLCTVDGKVFVMEENEEKGKGNKIRILSPDEILRTAGPGG